MIWCNMNFNDLSIFKTIYELKSINKAALKLGYTQSNITARLKALEKEVNAPLFVRSNLGVRPTSSGEKMYKFATTTLQNYQDLKASLTTSKPQILIAELLFGYLITKKTKFLIDRYEVIIKNTDAIQEMLTKKTYDIVMTFVPISSSNYLLTKKSSLQSCFLTGKGTENKKIPIAINADFNCPFRDLTLQLASNKSEIIEIDSLEMILQLVKQGKATALLPKYLISDDLVPANKQTWEIPYYSYRYQF